MNNLNCITGGEKHLKKYIVEAFKKAKRVDIIVSFLRESGVKLLQEELKDLKARNIPVRLLTGNYLNITQPSALYLMKDIFSGEIDMRLYGKQNVSFHPKAYIFEYEDDFEIFVGSSNLSKSALTSGIEWNYRIKRSNSEEDFDYFFSTFEDLFLNQSIVLNDDELRKYSNSWVKPKRYSGATNGPASDEAESVISPQATEHIGDHNVTELFEPRGAQIEALYHLKKTREEGFDKGLVVAATGVGKTYLSAFDSLDYKKILFVAHQEEILEQAERTFKTIRPNEKTGFFNGSNKDKEVDALFASVFTIGKDVHLKEHFKPDDFDYIVVDEFHHAASKTFRNVIDYFKPKFMLGLTATPDRMDNQDIYELCDYNVVYDINFFEAINRELLVPFRYYGIYDNTVNYSDIKVSQGKYNGKELEIALSINNRAELIYNNYKKYNSKMALGFCSSIKHAEYMAEYFKSKGISSCAVHSGDESEFKLERKDSIKKLKNGELKVIFSVDMFNEGVDIKELDMVLFLRPTQSQTIFLQQLGRGLRICEGKKYLNILDFIGNYKKADSLLLYKSYENNNNRVNTNRNPGNFVVPEDCIIDLDFELIDLITEMRKRGENKKDKVIKEFFEIKENLGYTPSRVEFFMYLSEEGYNYATKNGAFKPFKDYLKFLTDLDLLENNEEAILNTFAHEFIKMLETTSMSKTYKMAVIKGFIKEDNTLKMKMSMSEVTSAMKEFYSMGSNKVDMIRTKNTKSFESWEEEEYIKLAKDMPLNFLIKSSGEFFKWDGEFFALNEKISSFKDNETFVSHIKDAMDYRVKEYYKNRNFESFKLEK